MFENRGCWMWRGGRLMGRFAARGRGELNVIFETANDMIYLLTAIGLTPGDSVTVHTINT